MSTNLLNVFLSYGRRDAAALAERLVQALRPLGFDVWRDTAELRAGRAWEQQIQDALRHCDVVLALLSPHSTRSIAGGAGDDSVCLDELAAARYGTPARPIVPVLAAAGASTPLTVLRLHQLDFTAAMADGADFEARLPGLVQALHDAVAGQPAMRRWEEWLGAPPEAGAFLRAKHRGFSGRAWLFDEIDRWRASDGAPALLVCGEPGIGKSALIAELTLGAHAGATLATHCCQWDVIDSLRPGTCLRVLAQQCALRLPAYAAQLDDERLRPYFERADSDPGAALEHGLLAPLSAIAPPAGGPWLWCIDALDEAMLHRGSPTLVDLLASRLDRLPPWLRVVATTRDDPRVRRALGEAQTTVLQADTPENLHDLRRHVQGALAALQLDGTLAEGVLANARGSFLYADFVLRAMARGQLTAGALPDLPPGLNGLYERELGRVLPDDRSADRLRPLLAMLCAAMGPLPSGLLAAAAGMTPRELQRQLAPLQPFLRRQDDGPDGPELTFWHKSIHDFLTGPDDADSRFAVDREQGDALLAARVSPQPPLLQYLRAHGLDHLAGCGNFLQPLDDASLKQLLRLMVSGTSHQAVGALPTAWPVFVGLAVQHRRWDDLRRLLFTIAQLAEDDFQAAGLWTMQAGPEGREVRLLTGQATEPGALAGGLRWLLLAVSVLDQVRALHGTAAPFDAWMGRFALAHYVVGGLDMAGWASGLSGYFEDQGTALNAMFNNLRSGAAARNWGRQG